MLQFSKFKVTIILGIILLGIIFSAPNLVPRGDGPEARLARQKVLGGFGGVHLVGTPERIVDRLAEIAQAGADGVVLSFVNFEEGLTTWMSDVTPLLVQAGLRQ